MATSRTRTLRQAVGHGGSGGPKRRPARVGALSLKKTEDEVDATGWEASTFVYKQIEAALKKAGYVFHPGVGIEAPKRICELVSDIAGRWYDSLVARRPE